MVIYFTMMITFLYIWNDFPGDIRTATSLPPLVKSFKLTCLQKPARHSLPITPVSSWYDLAVLTVMHFVYVQMRLRDLSMNED